MNADFVAREAIGRLGLAVHANALSDRILYAGRPCLRIGVFHSVGGVAFERFRRFVERVSRDVAVVGPDEIVSLDRGLRAPDRKELALTFDDGFRNHFGAGRWLADIGVRALFFVMPSFLGRSGEQYLAYHAARGVRAFLPSDRYETPVGLDPSQVREMRGMGHVIGLHPDAHRSLGCLGETDVLHDVAEGKARLEELLREQVSHFAYAFGHVRDASAMSERIVRARCEHVYMASRGGNLPDAGPRCLLRDNVSFEHPEAFARLAALGGLDVRYLGERWGFERLVGRRGRAVAGGSAG